MRIRSIIFVLVAAVIATLGVQAPADAAAKVQIVKVYFDSPGADHGSNASVNAEWVRIKNNASHTKTLTG